MEAGDYPLALQQLLKADKLAPNNPVIQNNLGLVYFHRNRMDLAQKHLKLAVELDPKFSDARNNYSRVLLEAGNFAEAEKQVRIVINDLTYPSPEKALINFGLIKFSQKDFPAARRAFQQVIKTQPDDCVANNYLGRTYFEESNYERSLEALDRAIGFCQSIMYDEAHYFSALTYYRLGNKSKSMTRFEELIKYYPNGQYREKAKGMLDILRKGQ